MFYPATPRHSVGPNSMPALHLDNMHPPSLQPAHHNRNSHQQPPHVHQPQPQRPAPTVSSISTLYRTPIHVTLLQPTPGGKTRSSRNRVIPPEEDVRRLFQECKVGRGNASLLSEALAYAKPEDLKSKEIIKVSVGSGELGSLAKTRCRSFTLGAALLKSSSPPKYRGRLLRPSAPGRLPAGPLRQSLLEKVGTPSSEIESVHRRARRRTRRITRQLRRSCWLLSSRRTRSSWRRSGCTMIWNALALSETRRNAVSAKLEWIVR